MRGIVAMTAGVAILGGCARPAGHADRIRAAPPALSITTQLLGDGGELRGTAALTAEAEGTRIVVRVEGLRAGNYGVRLHGVGRCEGPDFAAAGPLVGGAAGSPGTQPRTLPDIVVASDGRGTVDAVLAGLQLTGGPNPLLDDDGAAIIVRRSTVDPANGPDGPATACGVLRRR